jgi:hypothetical protein
MSINQFFRDLASTVAGGGERRFGRDLARTLGFRAEEPSSGKKPKPTPPPPAVSPPKTKPPKAGPVSASRQRGRDDGKNWGFNRAYRATLQRLDQWAAATGGKFSGREAAAVIFPKPEREWVKVDADKLLAGDDDYAAGFVEGAMVVWRHQLAKEAEQAKVKT